MIWILSGTKDGRHLISELADQNYPLIVTTATEYGKSLLQDKPRLKVISKRLNNNEMIEFIKENSIDIVIDATHPYAKEVSENIYNACMEMEIQCIRFQRDTTNLDNYKDALRWADSYEDAADILRKEKGRILLTTGSKTLEIFAKKINPARLVPRILPLSNVINKCEKLGIKPSNIIAMQGPFSKEMNVEIMKKYNIDIMVTKDSGKIGGTDEKLEAAMLLNIPSIIISRPRLINNIICNNLDKLLDKVRELYE